MSNGNSESFVLKEREGAILVLTLNRPDKSNSLHPDLAINYRQPSQMPKPMPV